MALFGKKEECLICNSGVGKTKIEGGSVCKECLSSCGKFLPKKNITTLTKCEIETAIQANKMNISLFNEFVATKKVGTYIEFDESKKQWLVPDGFVGKKVNPKIYNFSDILEYELLEDDESITKGGLGGAIAGGVLFGGVGAIVGGVTGKRKTKSVINSLKIKITIKDINDPVIYINLIQTQTKSSSFVYKVAYQSAQEILSVLSVVRESEKVSDQVVNRVENNSTADELIKLKDLLDSGILTAEEFQNEKSKLLSR